MIWAINNSKSMAVLIITSLIVSYLQLIMAKADRKANLIDLNNMNEFGDKSGHPINNTIYTNYKYHQYDCAKKFNDEELYIGFLAGYSHSKVIIIYFLIYFVPSTPDIE